MATVLNHGDGKASGGQESQKTCLCTISKKHSGEMLAGAISNIANGHQYPSLILLCKINI